jgi:SnoaL-like domain
LLLAASPRRYSRLVPSASSERFSAWVARYERAWRTAGTESLRSLFAENATYQAAPFDEPLRGIDEIAVFWEAEREGPDELFTLTSEIVAADSATAVARLEVQYGEPMARTYRDLWVITLDPSGLCTAFEEWPFFPGQNRIAG